MELGLYTFADMHPEKNPGKGENGHQRMKELLDEIQLADQLGLDVFGVGEHHRPDYAISSPAVVLGAAAALTRQIRLTSAVTVLSSDDPVRVFQDFSTIDLLSGGRAEIMAGRGSFIESYPLFGYDLEDYDELFTEKLDLLLKLNETEIINWNGVHRAPIAGRGVYPRPYQQKIPIWLAVGGTPDSAIRAGTIGLPMALAIIGGEPHRFVPFVNLYRETAIKSGHDRDSIRLGINSHVYLSENSQQAADEFYPTYSVMMNRIGRERGWSPVTRQHFEQSRSPKGSLMVGSPQQVIDKILYEHELFKQTRFLAQMSVGTLPHTQVMRSIELFGTRVAPAIRKATNLTGTTIQNNKLENEKSI